MKIEELNIGFYVHPDNALDEFNTYVYDCKDGLVSLYQWGSMEPSHLSPIVLTETWMKELGFYPIINPNSTTSSSYDYNAFIVTFKEDKTITLRTNGIERSLNFVHELQHAVFYLTGYTKIVWLDDGYTVSFMARWDEGYRKGSKVRVITPTRTYVQMIINEHDSGVGRYTYDLM